VLPVPGFEIFAVDDVPLQLRLLLRQPRLRVRYEFVRPCSVDLDLLKPRFTLETCADTKEGFESALEVGRHPTDVRGKVTVGGYDLL
jgi:hypothetical protein